MNTLTLRNTLTAIRLAALFGDNSEVARDPASLASLLRLDRPELPQQLFELEKAGVITTRTVDNKLILRLVSRPCPNWEWYEIATGIARVFSFESGQSSFSA